MISSDDLKQITNDSNDSQLKGMSGLGNENQQQQFISLDEMRYMLQYFCEKIVELKRENQRLNKEIDEFKEQYMNDMKKELKEYENESWIPSVTRFLNFFHK